MEGKRHTTEDKIRILRDADRGKTILEVCREHNISEVSFHRWKRQNGHVESFHGSLRDECLNREQLWTLTRPAWSSRPSAASTTSAAHTASSATRARLASRLCTANSPRLPSKKLDKTTQSNDTPTSPRANSLPGSEKRVPSLLLFHGWFLSPSGRNLSLNLDQSRGPQSRLYLRGKK